MAILLLISILSTVSIPDDFYESRLRVGEEFLRQGRPADAATELRIAAFGLLDRPELLCQALAARAVAESAAGQQAHATESLKRLLRMRSEFQECRTAHIEPIWRQRLVALARDGISEQASRELSEVAREVTPVVREAAPQPPARTAPQAAFTPTPVSIPTATRIVQSPVTTPQEVPVSDLDRQPQLRKTTTPTYPPDLLRSRIGGIVLLRVLVSETGKPLDIQLARGVQPDLDRAAVESVRQWLFEPGRKGDLPVSAWMTVAVPFEPKPR